METGPRFKVSSERLEERGIEPATVNSCNNWNFICHFILHFRFCMHLVLFDITSDHDRTRMTSRFAIYKGNKISYLGYKDI